MIGITRIWMAGSHSALIEKVCPDIGEEAIRAALQKQNGSET
jgi:hypothetical protein